MRKNTINHLTIANIKRKPMRTFGLVFIVMLFTFMMLAGSLMTLSLSRGVALLSDRLGADVMAVPAGHEAKIESVLLQGSPNPFYLPNNALDKLNSLAGIAKMSPQTYITKLETAYYDQPIQLIGIEPDSDFLISAWLNQKAMPKLADDQCIIGYRINSKVGDVITLFDKDYRVVGSLKQTGLAFDATIFVNRTAAKQILRQHLSSDDNTTAENDDLISTVMIKLKTGFRSEQVARQINHQFADEGIFGMYSKRFVNSMSSNLLFIVRAVNAAIVAIGLLTIIIMSLVFSMILRERKKEIATLRILGANKGQLNALIVKESALVSLIGALIGIVLSFGLLYLYGVKIAANLKIPFILPNFISLIGWALGCLLIGLLIGPLSSLYALRKMARWEIYHQFRENE